MTNATEMESQEIRGESTYFRPGQMCLQWALKDGWDLIKEKE